MWFNEPCNGTSSKVWGSSKLNKLLDSYRVASLLKLVHFKVQFLPSKNVEIKPIFDGNV